MFATQLYTHNETAFPSAATKNNANRTEHATDIYPSEFQPILDIGLDKEEVAEEGGV